MLFGSVIAQTVNEFVPAGGILVALIISVLISLVFNIFNGIKKYKNETKKIREESQGIELNNSKSLSRNKEKENPSEKVILVILI